MWDFVCFWGRCLVEGVHVGHGAFAGIESLCVLIGAGLHWQDKIPLLKKFHEQWKPWEERAMKWAFLIAGIAFVISTVCFAPFLQFRESEHAKVKAETDLSSFRDSPVSQRQATLKWDTKAFADTLRKRASGKPPANKNIFFEDEMIGAQYYALEKRFTAEGIEIKTLHEIVNSTNSDLNVFADEFEKLANQLPKKQ